MKYTSELIREAVEALSMLPGIGKKTAMRMVLFLAKQDDHKSLRLSQSITRMVEGLKECKVCYAYSDDELCGICSNPVRDQSTICVVESIRDLMAIEETQHYRGLYHVLGGLISPIEGLGPDQINIEGLLRRIQTSRPSELIMALRPSIEGDTTIYYISRQPGLEGIQLSQIARGISFGSDLEFADEFTLSRSLATRTPYSLKDKLPI
ncbi:MAG: recombination protein RecR [Saprospiraceae bacterium]|nr:recombination protein RecR [Saprospiraceae bacterium]MBK7811838.1 recombination protein RecR [Saprospiraceae bacterium]MBK9631841.1 recombination protein RecR [Saprospiraceae bacterium]